MRPWFWLKMCAGPVPPRTTSAAQPLLWSLVSALLPEPGKGLGHRKGQACSRVAVCSSPWACFVESQESCSLRDLPVHRGVSFRTWEGSPPHPPPRDRTIARRCRWQPSRTRRRGAKLVWGSLFCSAVPGLLAAPVHLVCGLGSCSAHDTLPPVLWFPWRQWWFRVSFM